MDINASRIKSLMENENYEALLEIATKLLEQIAEENTIGREEFETLKLVFLREGKLQGIKTFLNKLDQVAQG